VELGFTSTVGIIHDNNGQLKPLGTHEQEIFEEVMALGKRSFSRFNEFQHNVARGREHNWRCRSGSRYLYICEEGLVHWCSQQRGYPGIPLAEYTPEMRHREYSTKKFCAARCTVSCVQQVGILDNWRDPQNLQPMPMMPPATRKRSWCRSRTCAATLEFGWFDPSRGLFCIFSPRTSFRWVIDGQPPACQQ